MGDGSVKTGPAQQADELDVLIVGAGFSGLYQLDRLRDLGFKVKIFEAAPELGGTWYWNCYPGARVDSHCPVYQFAHKDLWRNFEFSELYPSWEEMRRYFQYVDEALGLSRDIVYNARVAAAHYDDEARRWTVTTEAGDTVRARYVSLCVGFTKPYFPPIEGLEGFAGPCHHTAEWPQEGLDFTGKRVGVIGTGASGVQIVQSAAPVAESLTVFQRTPIMCLPMPQRQLSSGDEAFQARLSESLASRDKCFGGFDFDFIEASYFDASPEDREALFERLWADGGFSFWLRTYPEVLMDETANRHAYTFWRDKIRTLIDDPQKRDLLAPMEPPHPFGVKRPSLQQTYWEAMNRDTVSIVNLRETPIERITDKAVVTAAGEHPLDVLVLATGSDAVTGAINDIDIRGTGEKTLKETWAQGVRTHLGVAVAGFPNLLFSYGPQAPTAFANGPSSAEYQGEHLVQLLKTLKDRGLDRIEATHEAEDSWNAMGKEIVNASLFPKADSWYMGANIPGKPREMLVFTGGLPLYLAQFQASADAGYSGFRLG
ncbi:MAG: NAD(P)/FAD-dependent oxidoreductase [Pseudomonadota bacterium]